MIHTFDGNGKQKLIPMTYGPNGEVTTLFHLSMMNHLTKIT
jgi:hypothetical protein